MNKLELLTIFLIFIEFFHLLNCCEVGWYPYKKNKCVVILDTVAKYDESVEYCNTAFNADLLSISFKNEKKFWTVHLFRYLNITENVWLQPLDKKTISLLNNETQTIVNDDNKCLAFRSEKGALKNLLIIGDIVSQDCNSFGNIVCEITAKPKSKPPTIPRNNPNSEFVRNKQIIDINGNETGLFSGLYYRIISKHNNQVFMNDVIGNGKCSLDKNSDLGECEYYSKNNNDTDVNLPEGKFYLLTQMEKGDNISLRIRRFTSLKQIYSSNKTKTIEIFEPFKDRFKSSIIFDGDEASRQLNLWKLEKTQFKDYFIIKSIDGKSMVGVTKSNEKSLNSTGFTLYNTEFNSSNLSDSRILFRFEFENFTFNAQLYSIEFDQSLEEIVKLNKKQISLLDTAIINNDSPADLNHEVSIEKQFTESFSTSFSSSAKFLKSFAVREEESNSNTFSNTQSKSLMQSATEGASESLTQSLTKMSSQTDSTSDTHEAEGSVSVGFMGFGGSASYKYTHTSTHDRTSSETNEESKNVGTHKENTISNENKDEKTKSETNANTNSKEKSNGKEESNEASKSVSITQSRTYRISKTVVVPPYSAVKISSFANWVNGMTIPFKLNIKFSANSWRRKTDGSGGNEWRTLDAEFVEYYLKTILKFPGNIINKDFDVVYGQIYSTLTASVGLESVFSSKEINLNENS